MGRHRHTASDNSITRYVRTLFAKQAMITGAMLLVVSAIIFLGSIKFSTDRLTRIVCNQVDDSSRILVETAHLETYKGFFDEAKTRMEVTFGITDVDVVKSAPPLGWRHYSLGSCTIHWESVQRVAFYSPSHWLGETVYVRGFIVPQLFHTDLILFMLVICVFLIASYNFGSRLLLRNIKQNVSVPISEMWESLRTGGEPANLELRELRNLWESLVEYKQLLGLRNSMWIAKQYYHEVKSPSFYLYNQLKRLTIVDDADKQKVLIGETLVKADKLITQMERALKKIATDDFADKPEVIDLAALVGRKDSKYRGLTPIQVTGFKLLVRTLLNNLYRNAVQACGDLKLVETKITEAVDEIVLSIKNPVAEGYDVDTKKIFVSDYSGKMHGTGIGLSLCQHIMNLHAGTIDAEFLPEQRTFEIIVRFPKGGSLELAPQQNGLPS